MLFGREWLSVRYHPTVWGELCVWWPLIRVGILLEAMSVVILRVVVKWCTTMCYRRLGWPVSATSFPPRLGDVVVMVLIIGLVSLIKRI